MWNENYNISIIPQDLRKEETIQHYADALDHMEAVSDDIFNRVSKRVEEDRKHLESLKERINVAEAKINVVKGSNKAIQVFSSSKYPANNELQNYVSVFADIDKSMQNVTRKYRKIKSQLNAFSEQEINEKKQYYQVPVVIPQSLTDSHEGLGSLPKNSKYVSSFLFFNSSENPYKKYSIFDPLGASGKTKTPQEEDESGLADAPMSISNREEMERHDVENYLYIPDLGDVPEIDVPMDLPDLPGVADLTFSSDNIQGIAPSLLNVPNLPDLPGVTPDNNPPPPSLDNNSINLDPGPPPPSSNIPPPPPINNPIPPPPVINALAPAPTSTPASAPPAVPSNSGGGRSDLLASIRATGGVGKVKLKSSKERKLEKKKAKEEAPVAASGGGDLMSDLFSKLAMRRKGISGAKKPPDAQSTPSSGGGSAMDKISAMIPPPPPVASNQSNQNDDDDWN